MNKIRKAASELVEKDLSQATSTQITSELKVFIAENGGEEFLLDDDLYTLFELAFIYSETENIDQKLNEIQTDLLQLNNPIYKRIGKLLRPKVNKEQKRIIEKMAQDICRFHLDLNYKLKEKGVCFIDSTNAVFTFESLRQIEDMPNEYSGIVSLSKIKNNKQLQKVVDPRYIKSKDWSFRGSRKRCEGKYFTFTELLDLITNRKIITFDRYE